MIWRVLTVLTEAVSTAILLTVFLGAIVMIKLLHGEDDE